MKKETRSEPPSEAGQGHLRSFQWEWNWRQELVCCHQKSTKNGKEGDPSIRCRWKERCKHTMLSENLERTGEKTSCHLSLEGEIIGLLFFRSIAYTRSFFLRELRPEGGAGGRERGETKDQTWVNTWPSPWAPFLPERKWGTVLGFPDELEREIAGEKSNFPCFVQSSTGVRVPSWGWVASSRKQGPGWRLGRSRPSSEKPPDPRARKRTKVSKQS